MWRVECKVWSEERGGCRVLSVVECGVWSVERGVRSEECKM